MPNSVGSVFTNPVFRPGSGTTGAKQRAIGGFKEIFGSVIAKQMRTAMVGDGAMGDSASSDIVGGLFDQAMGHTLAKSKALDPIGKMLERQLDVPTRPGFALEKGATRTKAPAKIRALSAIDRISTKFPLTVAPVRAAASNGTSPPTSAPEAPLVLPPTPPETGLELPPPSITGGAI